MGLHSGAKWLFRRHTIGFHLAELKKITKKNKVSNLLLRLRWGNVFDEAHMVAWTVTGTVHKSQNEVLATDNTIDDFFNNDSTFEE